MTYNQVRNSNGTHKEEEKSAKPKEEILGHRRVSGEGLRSTTPGWRRKFWDGYLHKFQNHQTSIILLKSAYKTPT